MLILKINNCISVDEMAAFKSAVIIGENGDVEKKQQEKLGLEGSNVELQKLFIYLTSKGGIE